MVGSRKYKSLKIKITFMLKKYVQMKSIYQLINRFLKIVNPLLGIIVLMLSNITYCEGLDTLVETDGETEDMGLTFNQKVILGMVVLAVIIGFSFYPGGIEEIYDPLLDNKPFSDKFLNFLEKNPLPQPVVDVPDIDMDYLDVFYKVSEPHEITEYKNPN